ERLARVGGALRREARERRRLSEPHVALTALEDDPHAAARAPAAPRVGDGLDARVQGLELSSHPAPNDCAPRGPAQLAAVAVSPALKRRPKARRSFAVEARVALRGAPSRVAT